MLKKWGRDKNCRHFKFGQNKKNVVYGFCFIICQLSLLLKLTSIDYLRRKFCTMKKNVTKIESDFSDFSLKMGNKTLGIFDFY